MGIIPKKEKSMGKYFGTDGFRGEAGVSLTALDAFRVGRVLGSYMKKNKKGDRLKAVIGKDTRRSSYMLEYAIASGLASVGADAHMLHVITTPGVTYATVTEGFDLGVMISASHNPFYDNGIKVISGSGEKINDADIEELERMMDGDSDITDAKGADIGRIVDWYSGRNRYIGYLISLSLHSFKNYKVGLDCANGASFMIAKSVFEALGARVTCVGDEPDGININEGVGSTHIENLSKIVKEKGLDIGFAFDGDADRCIAVDENGEVINGDHIIYVLGTAMKKRGELKNNTVVTTIMSNLGLYRALDAVGINYEKTTVGDRYVYENMRENGHVLGAEQSGHVIMSKYATTGDGILTAIKIMEAVIEAKAPLSKLASPVKMLPQVTINVRVKSKAGVTEREAVKKKYLEAEKALLDKGRILLRESGTEPVIRVMVEADSEEICRKYAESVAEAIRASEA